MDKNELILKIVDTLIWPLTVIGFLVYYRLEVKDKLKNLQSAKFSVDGAEMNFNLEQMKEELKDSQAKLGQGKTNSKNSNVQGRGVGKKSSSKPKLVDSDLSPYQQVFMINSKVEEYLKQMAVENNISTDDFESLKMTDMLTQKGIIDLETRDKLIKITKLIRAVNPKITKEQIEIVRKYYENI